MGGRGWRDMESDSMVSHTEEKQCRASFQRIYYTRRGGLVSRTILIPQSNTISAAFQFSSYLSNSP